MANFSTTDKHRWTRIKNQIPPEVGRKPRFKSSNFGLQINVWKIIILHMGTMKHLRVMNKNVRLSVKKMDDPPDPWPKK